MPPETKRRSIGTVTVLFTDVVGSTELLDRFGDDVADRVRRKHFKRLRQLVRAFGGNEVKSLGDGLMVVFSSASDAAACAVAIQQATATDPGALPVRVGLHTGEAVWEDKDLYGGPVVVARRLCDKAEGGQILASDLVRGLIGRRGSFSFDDMGFMELKGFRAPMPTAEVLWREHPTELVDSALAEPKAPRRGNLAAAVLAVGIAAIVAILAVVWVVAGEDGTTGPTQPTDPGPEPGSLSIRWATEDLGTLADASGEQIILDLAIHRGRLIAPGRDQSRGNFDAVVWMRTESGVWRRSYPDGANSLPGDQMIFSVVGRGRTLIAVGTDNLSGRWDPAVWMSKDLGRRWTRTDESLAESGDQVIFSIADDGSRFVASGYSSARPGQADAAIWLSRNGRSWTRVTGQKEIFGRPGRSEARDVVATKDGFVAVGGYDVSVDESDAAVWFSRTGKVWERVGSTTFARPRDQKMMSVVRTDSGVLAAGFDAVVGDKDAALWTSTDGLNWERMPQDETVFGGLNDQIIYALAAGPGYVAGAGVDARDGGEDAVVWLSLNGEGWRRMPADENVLGGDGVQEMRGAVIDGREVITAGESEESGDADGTVWTGSVTGL
jgi:class 3 adenylate cyclase